MHDDFPFDPEFARAIAHDQRPLPPSPLVVARELNAEAERVAQLRKDALFSNEVFMADRFTPKAEQIFLQALAHLELAERTLKLAALEMDV